MKRRVALQNMAAALGGLVALPAWAEGWSAESLGASTFLSPAKETLLAEVVETIIPATDTPGAKALGLHSFVQKMITDCYDKSVQLNFTKSLTAIESLSQASFKKPFVSGTAEQRLGVLRQLETSSDADQQAFFKLVKNLTVKGYTTSEYFLTKLVPYEMVPGRYIGCAPVEGK